MKAKRGERVRKKSTVKTLGQWFHSVSAKSTALIAAAAFLIFVAYTLTSMPEKYQLQVGAISHYTITASKDVVDEITTEERRQASANAVEPSYHLQENVAEEVRASLRTVLNELRTVQQYGATLLADVPEGETKSFSTDEVTYAQGLVHSISFTNYQLSTVMRATAEHLAGMESALTTAVDNAMSTTIREGQVNQSIQTILQIVGFRVETSLYQNVVPTILRNCLKANMLIEEETTQAARQKARDAVEPVVYLQGQNIIREGERVSTNQMEMVRALGLLDDNTLDLNVYVGMAALILIAMVMMVVMLHLMAPAVLHDLRRLGVMLVCLVLAACVCAVIVKLSHVYLAPVALAAMLVTGMLGATEGLVAAVTMTMLASIMVMGATTAYTTEMVLETAIALVTGLVSVRFLNGRPQRVRTILCGFLAGILNIGVMAAVGAIISSDHSFVATNFWWCAGGGIIAGGLAVGIQPIIELIFNLATPAKLLELSNPNQPLLRRLLIEASGTYHHSIIVANLAEAAAEKVGANPLLARTGAYFHDIGKLKRPLYFKENQMGDNPHDRTDPYVSAAILTAHTRDGLLLAQKYHLPPEVQKIISEHHGDTPVMYFYHKAVQMAGNNPVDIADFRYDSPKPTIRESAIVMLADTVEAAVRAMSDPTPETIEQQIRKLVGGKLEDGQLSNAPLTLKDIDLICDAFCTVLNGAFHERIEYPNMDIAKHQASAPAAAEESAKEDAPEVKAT